MFYCIRYRLKMSEQILEIDDFIQDNSIWSVRSKWRGAALGGELGYQAVPDILLRKQHILQISNTELVVLLNITLHWWKSDKWPHPRPFNIARRMGVSTRTVERAIRGLEEKKLIKRTENELSDDGHSIRYFDLTNLVDILNKLTETY